MTTTTLALEGRLDTPRVAQVEIAFAAKAGALIRNGDRAILDLSGVTFLSSLGIRLLVTTVKQFQSRGVRFATVRPREQLVIDTLAVANLDGLLNIAEDHAAAEAMVNLPEQ